MNAPPALSADELFAAVKDLLANPERKFGRSYQHTLSDLVRFGLKIATVDNPLDSVAFEREHKAIVLRLRTPTNEGT